MNFAARDEPEPQFQLAPMIDIIFLLLIFFVATYTVAQEERTLDINLPAAQAAEEKARVLEDIVVNLNRDGKVTLNRRPYTLKNLRGRLRQLAQFTDKAGVIIRADGACEHRYVVKVMDMCADLGIRRVSFSTAPEPAGRKVNDLPRN